MEKTKSKTITKVEAILFIWENMEDGEFNLTQFEIKVRNLLRKYRKGISGSGLTALMRYLRRTRDDFDYGVVNDDEALYKKIANK